MFFFLSLPIHKGLRGKGLGKGEEERECVCVCQENENVFGEREIWEQKEEKESCSFPAVYLYNIGRVSFKSDAVETLILRLPNQSAGSGSQNLSGPIDIDYFC